MIAGLSQERDMQVLVTTDNNVQGSQALIARVTAEVEGALRRFGTQVTRVAVHLGDSNSHKKGDDDKRCVMEARLAGLDPVAASHRAATLDEAISGATDVLQQTLERTLERLVDKKRRASHGDEQTP
jgi:hypothetical protein